MSVSLRVFWLWATETNSSSTKVGKEIYWKAVGWFIAWKEKLEDQVGETWQPGSPRDPHLFEEPHWGIHASHLQSSLGPLLWDMVESCGRGQAMSMDRPIRLYLMREEKFPQRVFPPQAGTLSPWNTNTVNHLGKWISTIINCKIHITQTFIFKSYIEIYNLSI